jgi:hypothetical protein
MEFETIEEAAENILIDTLINGNNSFDLELDSEIKEDVINAMIQLAKWQKERSYSEEEVLNILQKVEVSKTSILQQGINGWFEQFKKK